MIDTENIPKSVQMTFRRLLNRIPPEMREDEEVQKKLILYLKTGGEKLGRSYLTLCQESFPEDIRFVKVKPLEAESDAEGDDAEDDGAKADDAKADDAKDDDAKDDDAEKGNGEVKKTE